MSPFVGRSGFGQNVPIVVAIASVGMSSFLLGWFMKGRHNDRYPKAAVSGSGAQSQNADSLRTRESLVDQAEAVPASELVGYLRQLPMKALNPRGPMPPHSTARAVLVCASGKGGVGKSTTSVNLAYMLKELGLEVGLLDLDIYGPSLPQLVKLPMEAGVMQNEAGRIVPLDYAGVGLMSWGYIQPGEAATIRAPIANEMTKKLLTDVEWGALDVLLVDTPPGTGDVLLSLAQTLAVDGAVLVTTANDLSLADVVKGVKMFEKVEIPPLLAVLNMASFECHKCGYEHELFADGSVAQLPSFLTSKSIGLLRLPLDPELSRAPAYPLPPHLFAYPYVRNIDFESRPAWKGYRRLAHAVLSALLGVGVEKPVRSGEAAAASLFVRAGGMLEVRLKGGELKSIECGRLRAACKCAHCVDDMTGELKIDQQKILKDRTIRAKDVEKVGNYAVNIHWADGHCTLIATKALEELVGSTVSGIRQAKEIM